MDKNRKIVVYYPKKTVFGQDAFMDFIHDFPFTGLKHLFILTIPALHGQILESVSVLSKKGIRVQVNSTISAEPSFYDFSLVLDEARRFKADSIAGIGGGSVLDTAKLVAALLDSPSGLNEIVRDNSLLKRNVYLACLPTTAGTGSEMSPNAIFYLPETGSKTAVISPALVPDASYIDPVLTLGVPPEVTAFTGFDALIHCLEAYVNRFSHPVTDLLALEGVGLIGRNLERAVHDGSDLEARTHIARGSMYGGMCLGPVNTAAVHALAYPLGNRYKIPHGLSVAVLLPYVLEYNLESATDRLAEISKVLGVGPNGIERERALEGIAVIRQTIRSCRLPLSLSQLKIPRAELPLLAGLAFTVQRLLRNNVRELGEEDILTIYKNAMDEA